MFAALQELAPGFRGAISDAFGADTPGHREAIRADVARHLELSDPAVTDLSRPPAPAAWSVSISHTVDRGGWLAAPKPLQIGFDLEVRARVKEPIIRRMCTPAEVDLVGDFALLWAAKEALFKALARGQPATLTQLRVTSWEASGGGVYFFAGGGRAHGLAQASERHAAAVGVVSA